MALNEFDMIQQFFAEKTIARHDVVAGIGDDAAIVQVPPQQELVISVDTLIADVHFPVNTSPFDIGYKALAVNLSDLAAMGAEPAWVTLALTLPDFDEAWLKAFCEGFFQLAKKFNVQLIGGDTTRASLLSITVQVHGFVPIGKALRRNGAKVGDLIYVTNTLGDAGQGLRISKQKKAIDETARSYFANHLNQPCPRVKEGLLLRDIAHSAIDISDGLLADLSHILQASQVGATIYLEQLPLSAMMKKNVAIKEARELALTAGDDYELCFTVASEYQSKVKRLLPQACKIGVIEKQSGLRAMDETGKRFVVEQQGYRHF